MATATEFPPERERNIKRKEGFQYQLITVAIQKGKKFGLNMVDTDNHVIVTGVENDSMCASLLEKFDRICDVDGIPVTDKELTKQQIIKGLKENRKVSLAVERPANKERLDQVQVS
ncbi:hypothetical protein GCK32_012589 [Trichostrongylus colubriformis]|uniref:PDZ domain-containing protein n=1 Tax=Trichostrongylus colubriformis TaxID=6319 RepID=A0AAN8F2E4_TRICO